MNFERGVAIIHQDLSRRLSPDGAHLPWVLSHGSKKSAHALRFRSTFVRQATALSRDARAVLDRIFSGESVGSVKGQRGGQGLSFLGEIGAYLAAHANNTLHLTIDDRRKQVVDFAHNVIRRARGHDDRRQQAVGFLTHIADAAPVRFHGLAEHPLLGESVVSLLARKEAAKGNHTLLKEINEILARKFQFADYVISNLAALSAREVAARDTVNDVRDFTAQSEKLGDILLQERESTRFVLPPTDRVTARVLSPRAIDFRHLDFVVPGDVASYTPAKKAELLQKYLFKLTTDYNPDSDLSTQFKAGLVKQLKDAIAAKKPLAFSLYLSLEKFANPFDTRNSQVDLGEFGVVAEMAQLVSVVSQITGSRPEIVILNESPVNKPFTNGSGDLYRDQLGSLFEAFGIADRVKVVPFGYDLFVNYLRKRSPADLVKHGLTRADSGYLGTVVRGMQEYLVDIYRGCYTQQLSVKGDQLVFKPRFTIASLLPQPIIDGIHAYIAKNFDAINKEGGQGFNSYLRSNVDPSLLSPVMSEKLWAMILKRIETPNDLQVVVGTGRKNALEQASHQGLSLKALMRMRYIMQDWFGESILHFVTDTIGGDTARAVVIPMSITSAKDKLSWSLGRKAKTGISIKGEEVAGVNPQHGAGVLVNGRIVSIPWQKVRENPDVFRPVTLNIGDFKLQGHEYLHAA